MEQKNAQYSERGRNFKDIHTYSIGNEIPVIYEESTPKVIGGPYREPMSEKSPRDQNPMESPKQKIKDPYKNFKIIHNTSVANSNAYNSPVFNPLKMENGVVTLMTSNGDAETFREQNPPINSAIKESNLQIEKINQMLEEHRKKKTNPKIVEESLSSPIISQNFIQEMKERISHRRKNSVSKQIQMDDTENVVLADKIDDQVVLDTLETQYDLQATETFGSFPKFQTSEAPSEHNKFRIESLPRDIHLQNPQSAREISSRQDVPLQMPGSIKTVSNKVHDTTSKKPTAYQNSQKVLLENNKGKETQSKQVTKVARNPTPNQKNSATPTNMKENININNQQSQKHTPKQDE
jgi:hypothetical protein